MLFDQYHGRVENIDNRLVLALARKSTHDDIQGISELRGLRL